MPAAAYHSQRCLVWPLSIGLGYYQTNTQNRYGLFSEQYKTGAYIFVIGTFNIYPPARGLLVGSVDHRLKACDIADLL